jgi:hypothetical protein
MLSNLVIMESSAKNKNILLRISAAKRACGNLAISA